MTDLPFSLDEALAIREWRRARRWLLTSQMPGWFVLGSLGLPWLVIPGIYSTLGGWTGQAALQSQPRWMFLTLALTLVGGAMAAAFARVSQLWQTERVRQTLEGWFLAGLPPGPLVVTASLSGAALALLLSAPGALLLLCIAIVERVPAASLLLTLALLIAGAFVAAAVATAAFLLPTSKETRHGTPVGRRFSITSLTSIAAMTVLVLALWLRIEVVEHGWTRPWEEHPARLLLALGLLTPAPALIGFADRRWWVFRVVERLDFRLTPEMAGLLLLLLYVVATFVLLRWSERAYRRLSAEPERHHLASPSAGGEEELTAAGSAGFWAGFANPVWTRELRTRLRGGEAPQFIFFASVALALGGFTPLVSAAGQLGDPLATAAVARDVFFWLAMTLAALIALVAPGLTAEAVGAERARGTLELLLTTPLRRGEILRGKLLGDLSVLALLASPSLPLLGFCYLFHGASGPQVLGVFVVLALMALLCAVIGTTASAMHARTMPAKWQAYLLSLLCCFFPGGPFWQIAMLATPGGEAAAGSLIYLVPLFIIVYGLVLAALWGRACERLEHLDG